MTEQPTEQSSTFEIFEDWGGVYRWREVAPNGVHVRTSRETFWSKRAARREMERQFPDHPAASHD